MPQGCRPQFESQAVFVLCEILCKLLGIVCGAFGNNNQRGVLAAFMEILAVRLHLNYIFASVVAIGACALLNFIISDKVVFK